MDQEKKLRTHFYWVFFSLLLCAINIVWSYGVQAEAARVRGSQRTFGPSPPPVAEWKFYITDSLLLLQFIVGAIGVWRVDKNRAAMGLFLLAIWFILFSFVRGNGFGFG
jgi:hypothetical protein